MAERRDVRERWQDPAACRAAAALMQELMDRTRSGDVDLRGAHLGNESSLPHLALAGGLFENIDVSSGKGVVIASHAKVIGFAAVDFHFDRASYFRKAEFNNSSFVRSRGRYDATDTSFVGCDFTDSQFRGGMTEYGFRRCRFVACNFRGTDWKNTYLRVCEFRDCTFEDARIDASLIVAAKFFGAAPWQALFAGSTVESVFVNGEKLPSP